MNKQTYGYDTNNYEVTVGNIKDEGIKLEAKIPMFEDGELERFDSNIHSIVEDYSKMMFKEKDQILTQRIIMKQEEEIERLNNIIKEVRELLKNDYFEDGSFTSQEKVFELLDKGE